MRGANRGLEQPPRRDNGPSIVRGVMDSWGAHFSRTTVGAVPQETIDFAQKPEISGQLNWFPIVPKKNPEQ